MRTTIMCLTLILASWAAVAAEQAQATKKVSAVKHAEKPAVTRKVPARKNKPVVASQRCETSKTRKPGKLGAKRATSIKTAALKPATKPMEDACQQGGWAAIASPRPRRTSRADRGQRGRNAIAKSKPQSLTFSVGDLRHRARLCICSRIGLGFLRAVSVSLKRAMAFGASMR